MEKTICIVPNSWQRTIKLGHWCNESTFLNIFLQYLNSNTSSSGRCLFIEKDSRWSVRCKLFLEGLTQWCFDADALRLQERHDLPQMTSPRRLQLLTSFQFCTIGPGHSEYAYGGTFMVAMTSVTLCRRMFRDNSLQSKGGTSVRRPPWFIFTWMSIFSSMKMPVHHDSGR